MKRTEVYIAAPRKILPLVTDGSVTEWIKSLNNLEAIAIQEGLSLPAAETYCNAHQILIIHYSGENEWLQTIKTIVRQNQHRSIAVVCAYSPPEGITHELKNLPNIRDATLSLF